MCKPIHDLIVNDLVRDFHQPSQQNKEGNHQFLFQENDSEGARSIRQIVKSDCLREEIIPHTSHHHSVHRQILASIDKSRPCEGNREVSLLKNEHSHQSLISIDDEIASKLSQVFSFRN